MSRTAFIDNRSMTPDTFLEAHVGQTEQSHVGGGIVVHRLYQSGPEDTARRALLVVFPPGSQWPGVDVHEPGPEDVYIVKGSFHGLTDDTSVHGPGTFLHFARGTSHSPSTITGGELFVYYPEG